MGRTDVNTGFSKCFIFFMAIVILIQGCVYLGLSIWGIAQRNCLDQTTDVAGNPFQFVIDLIYFSSESCGNPSITLPGEQNSIELTIDWAKSYMVTNRMYIFIIVYAVISGLWVVASLLVIATICGPVTKLVSAIVFWPWFLVVIAGSILDVVATGYNIHDIVHTTSAQESFEYVGIETPSNSVMTYLTNFDAYFITPAVVMTCASSRVVVMWLLNIFGTSFCLSLSRVLANQRQHPNYKQSDRQNMNSASINGNNTAAAMQYTAPRTEAQVVEYTTVQHRPAPLIITQSQPQQQQFQRQSQSQAQFQQQTSRTNPQSPYSTNTPNSPVLTPDVVIIENAHLQEQNHQPPSHANAANATMVDDTTYRKTDNHPDRLDYPPKTPTGNGQQAPLSSKTMAQLSSASQLNNRYSSAEGFYVSNTNQAPQRVSEELRGQLPWSYTSMLNKPQPPRKPQVQVYPQIPEPDYNEESDNNVNNQTQQSRW